MQTISAQACANEWYDLQCRQVLSERIVNLRINWIQKYNENQKSEKSLFRIPRKIAEFNKNSSIPNICDIIFFLYYYILFVYYYILFVKVKHLSS